LIVDHFEWPDMLELQVGKAESGQAEF